MPAAPHVFASNPLDRAPARRIDPVWLQAQYEDPRGRYLPFEGLKVGVSAHDRQRLRWLDRQEADDGVTEEQAVLLGLLEEVPHFALPVDGRSQGLALAGVEFQEPRLLATELAPAEAGILAQGRSLLEWHSSHRFCAQCGNPTIAIEGGARRLCTGCARRSYPQVSPSMIVLVEHEGRCLLARRARGAQHRYSCLAGFVEPGESIEDAVRREVYEESGVRVDDVRYHSSQPWPFPATLMIGCIAAASDDAVSVDGSEIAEARWFTREEVRRALDGGHPGLTVPEPIAIAHHLIRAWASER